MIQDLWEKSSRSVVSPGQIQYTFITPDINYQPNPFWGAVFSLLREFPRELLQLEQAAGFFDICYRVSIRKAINLFTLPHELFDQPLEEATSFFKNYSATFNRDVVKVFLIDNAVANHQQIATFLRHVPFSYFVFIGDPGEANATFYGLEKSFETCHELVALLRNDLPKINNAIVAAGGREIDDFDFDTNPDADEINPFHAGMYSKNNYYIINQILANYWKTRPENPSKDEFKVDPQVLIDRQLYQITVIDGLHETIKIKASVTPIEPLLPPMIITAPFRFPRQGKLLKGKFNSKFEKMIFRASQLEQGLNYNFNIEEDISQFLAEDQIVQSLTATMARLHAIDCLGYLHAQFTYSPVFRLPLMGKSLNMDLSHFQQSFPNKQVAIEKIASIGSLMKEKMIANDFGEILRERNGQLVFISDLPMEWLKLTDYPICLTHDVCRLPEFNVGSLLSNYMHNQRFEFRIKPDILKRTLIIHCASESDENMRYLFKVYDQFRPDFGFNNIICKSVEEISAAVKKHQPDLLIFDCHGDADEKTLSSYLVIDGKNKLYLTGDDIIKHSISAPLVFISACRTMPNYGYVKFLSDAFFQAGAFAVTATFLPIKMGDAATLAIRILSGLRQQENSVIFSNWLAFISHTLRSTLIFETIRKERLRNGFNGNVPDQDIADFLLEMMIFERREEVFERLKDYLRKYNPKIERLFTHLDHEWLSYTTMGRADLVYFDGWVKKHQMENFGSIL